MDAKFTPGPWEITPKSLPPDKVPKIGITAPGRWVNLAGVYRTAGSDGAEARANARLIAAAPALYEALSAVRDRLDYVRSLWGDEGITWGLRDRVHAALAEAEKGGGS